VDGTPAPLAWSGEGVFACSFVGVDDGTYVLFDPDLEEEEMATGRVCVVIDLERRIRWLYSVGMGLGRKQIKECVEIAVERAGYFSFVMEESAKKTGIV